MSSLLYLPVYSPLKFYKKLNSSPGTVVTMGLYLRYTRYSFWFQCDLDDHRQTSWSLWKCTTLPRSQTIKHWVCNESLLNSLLWLRTMRVISYYRLTDDFQSCWKAFLLILIATQSCELTIVHTVDLQLTPQSKCETPKIEPAEATFAIWKLCGSFKWWSRKITYPVRIINTGALLDPEIGRTWSF